MQTFSVLALAFAALFGALWQTRRTPGAGLAALCWLLYAGYEYLMHLRVLCTGECNIRVDLLVLLPLLAGFSLAVPFRYLVRRIKARQD